VSWFKALAITFDPKGRRYIHTCARSILRWIRQPKVFRRFTGMAFHLRGN
jgi:hypothetical protein